MAAHQDFLSFTISWSLLNLMSIESVTPSNYLILCPPLLLLPSICPSIRVFSNESVLRIRWPTYWSFSISPSNESSRLISFRIDYLISLQSKGLSSIFPSTTVWKHHFVSSQSLGLTLASVHDYQQNHSFDHGDLCRIHICMDILMHVFSHTFIFLNLFWVALVLLAGGSTLQLPWPGLSLWWLLLLWSTGCRHASFSKCGLQALETHSFFFFFNFYKHLFIL